MQAEFGSEALDRGLAPDDDELNAARQEIADLRGILELSENNGQGLAVENDRLREGIELLESDNAALREIIDYAMTCLNCDLGPPAVESVQDRLDELDKKETK